MLSLVDSLSGASALHVHFGQQLIGRSHPLDWVNLQSSGAIDSFLLFTREQLAQEINSTNPNDFPS